MFCIQAHKPTSVRHAVVGNFTSSGEQSLVLAKSTRLEIHLLTPDGLQPTVDVPIFGRIAAIHLYRPPRETTDLLFVLTERHKFCVLKYDKGELQTRANGDLSERIGEPTEFCAVDPECRMVALHLYNGAVKIIPIAPDGSLSEAFNIRLEELQVVSMAFVHGCPRPTLALVYKDTRDARHLKTYEVSLKDKDFIEGPWQQAGVEATASLLIPVPPPIGGAVVVCDHSVAYTNGTTLKSVSTRRSGGSAFCRIDSDGTRHLLGDSSGMLQLLVLEHSGGCVTGLKLQLLGETSAASTLSYLDNGVVYVGSAAGNSQLVRLQAAPDESGSHVELLESYPGLGPIVDFAVVDLERQGQCQVVTCSGLGKDGSLRVVRNGVGVNEQACVELAGVKGIWALHAAESDPHHSMLVVSFISETRVLAISAEDEMDETDIPGFSCSSQTLLCANTAHDQLLQVTPVGVFLVDAASRALAASWTPPAGVAITAAAAEGHQLLLGLGGGHLVYLEVGGAGQLREAGRRQLEQEVSCLDCHSTGSGPARLAAVGLWNHTVLLLALPGLASAVEERVVGEAIPRSVLIAVFEGQAHLLVGLGDGQLLAYTLDDVGGSPALSNCKKLALGTQPIALSTFRSKEATHAFAASDRPAVIYSVNKKLMFSNVNLREVSYMCPFNSASFPDSLAVASGGSLSIGTIDDIQKLHIRTVPLGEQPRRIAHQEASRTFLVACLKPTRMPDSMDCDAADECVLRLLDDQSFDTLAVYPLSANELVCSLVSTSFGDAGARQLYCVGTAFIVPDEMEPTRGRILVLAVEEGKLSLVAEKETSGSVSTLNPLAGKLLASIHNKVVVYRWTGSDAPGGDLVRECGFTTHILAINVSVRGDAILVGDLMRGASLLVYNSEEKTIQERALDSFSGAWTTAVEVVDDNTFLVAENSNNLLLLRKNGEATTDEERHRLGIAGEFHLGEHVNRFRHGSLVMRLPDSELSAVPTVIFGTIDGVLGVLASLPAEQHALLTRVQEAMCETVRGVGGLAWAGWRSFTNERRTVDARGFVDGDLIELFLELSQENKDAVARRVGLTAAALQQSIEAVMARIH